MQANDLRLRNGKLYLRLRDFATSDEERLHFDLYSYGCFYNITVEADQINEMSILGDYYLCHSIQNILSDDAELFGVEHQQLADEGKEEVKKALALYRKMDAGKNWRMKEGEALQREKKVGEKRAEERYFSKESGKVPV